jgi:hypothetical protein
MQNAIADNKIYGSQLDWHAFKRAAEMHDVIARTDMRLEIRNVG